MLHLSRLHFQIIDQTLWLNFPLRQRERKIFFITITPGINVKNFFYPLSVQFPEDWGYANRGVNYGQKSFITLATGRIVGGFQASPHSIPYQVGIDLFYAKIVANVGHLMAARVSLDFFKLKFQRCYKTQHNDTQHNDIQHNDSQRNGIWLNNKQNVTLSIVVEHYCAHCRVCWSVINAECHI